MAELEPDEETAEFIFTIVKMAQSTRKSVLEGSHAVHDADVTMWKHIDHKQPHDRDREIKSWKRMANYAFNTILRGCRTLA